MRVRVKGQSAVTGQQRGSAVNASTLRHTRHVTGRVVHTVRSGSRKAYGGYRTIKAKAGTAGHLDADQQVRASTRSSMMRAARVAALLGPRRGRATRSKLANRARQASDRAQPLDGQADSDHITGIAAENSWRWTRRTTPKVAVKVVKLTGQGMHDVGRLTGRAVKTGARVTRPARRRAARAAGAAARRARALAVHAAARTAAAVATGARLAVVAVVSAASGVGVPVLAGVLAVVMLATAMLPGFITGARRQAVEAEAASTVACAARTYELGPVKPHVQAAAELIGARFAIDTIGGWRPGNTYDVTGHPAGLAIDVMTDSTVGGQVTTFAETYAADLGVKYLIWNQAIWSVERSGEGWRPMADRGSASANHLDHVHISFTDTPPATTSAASEGSAASGASAASGGSGLGDSVQWWQPPASSGELAGLWAQVCGAAGTEGGWTGPVASLRVSSPYGMRLHPVTGIYKLHTGTDYAPGCGAPIYAAAAGTVTITRPAWAGMLVAIDHGAGVVTRYAHMYPNDVFVTDGQHVAVGQKIGAVGSAGWSTGCHLHFEVRVNGAFTDPARYLAQQGVQ